MSVQVQAVFRIKQLLWCGLLMLMQPALRLRAETNSATPLIDEVIAWQRLNEETIASVMIEGSYREVLYNQTGLITTIWEYDYFSFSRNHDRMRVRRYGHEQTVPDEARNFGDFARIKVDDVVFYSTGFTVEVNLDEQIAQKRPPERPQPYPLSFGYGLLYKTDGEIEPLSSAWRLANEERLLVITRDSDNPKLLLAEVRRDQIRVRSWIDPGQGNLIVKRRVDRISNASGNQWLTMDEYEITPKQFGKTWFLEKAQRRRYLPNSNLGGIYLREEQFFTVTNFLAGATFKLGELDFTTNSFPRLAVFQDKIANKTIDLTTGHVIPTNADTWVLHPELLPRKP